MKYLGHIISKEGVAVDDEKVKSVFAWPTPTTVHSFLGLCSYYRRFMKGLPTIVHQLTEKNRLFQWTEEAAEAFHQKLELQLQYLGIHALGRSTSLIQT